MGKLEHKFPDMIGDARFVRTLEAESKGSDFCLGLYEDNNGKEYVCKLWNAGGGFLKKRSIQNEIKAYKFLQETSLNFGYNNVGKVTVGFARMHKYKITKECIYLLIDKVEGEGLKTNNNEELLKVYDLINTQLNNYSKSARIETSLLTKRPAWFLFLLIHYYFLKALVKCPWLFTLLVKAIPTVYIGFTQMLFDRDSTLVIRDLSCDGNVLISSNKITVIDLESMTVGSSVLQPSSMITVESGKKSFVEYYLNSEQYKQDFLTNGSKRLNVLRALVVYGAIVDVCQNKRNVVKESVWLINRFLGDLT